MYFLVVEEKDRAYRGVLEGLGSAQEALKDPQLELVELPEAHERDCHRRGAFEDAGDGVAEREVFQVWRGGEWGNSRYGRAAHRGRTISGT